jgi:hypothetical protein
MMYIALDKLALNVNKYQHCMQLYGHGSHALCMIGKLKVPVKV